MSLSLTRAGLRVVLGGGGVAGAGAGPGQVRVVQGGSWVVAGWVQGRWVFPFPTLQSSIWVQVRTLLQKTYKKMRLGCGGLCRSTTFPPCLARLLLNLLPAQQIYYCARSQRSTLHQAVRP